ncbi:hypothetical protein HDU98_012256 [Podochytrium sp. JEL0797]|nr:hypothetical protein HDU98_012256 [Podochytrium sp. JEL0797]
MPQELQLSQIVPFAGIAANLVFNFANKPHHTINPQTLHPEIHVLPWVLQISFGLAYMMYAQNQGDVFLFVQSIPFLMSGLSHTLHWHPFYNKRIRKFHEYLLFISLMIVLITNASTTVYFQHNNTTVQQIGAGIPVVLLAALTTISLALEKWRLLSGSRPKALEVVAWGAGFLGASLWTAYGFWGINADWVVCTSSIMWVLFAIAHGLMIVYGIVYNGGMEMGWETEDDEGDVDVIVDRFNREPTILNSTYQTSPMQEYPPMMGDQSYGGSAQSSRMSMKGVPAGGMQNQKDYEMNEQQYGNAEYGDDRHVLDALHGIAMLFKTGPDVVAVKSWILPSIDGPSRTESLKALYTAANALSAVEKPQLFLSATLDGPDSKKIASKLVWDEEHTYPLFMLHDNVLVEGMDVGCEWVNAEGKRFVMDRACEGDIPLIRENSTVEYGAGYYESIFRNPHLVGLSRMIRQVVVLDSGGEKRIPASWSLVHVDFSIGLVSTMPEYLRRGFAGKVVASQVVALRAFLKKEEEVRGCLSEREGELRPKLRPYAFISGSNVASQKLFEGTLGFRRVPGVEYEWLGIQF